MKNARSFDYPKTLSTLPSILLHAAPTLRHRTHGLPARCLPSGGFPVLGPFGPGRKETIPRRTIHNVQEAAIAQ